MEPNRLDPSPGSPQTPTPLPAPPNIQLSGPVQPVPIGRQPSLNNQAVVSPDPISAPMPAPTPQWDSSVSPGVNSFQAHPSPAVPTATVGGAPMPSPTIAPTVVSPQLDAATAVPTAAPGQVISGGFDASASSLPAPGLQQPSPVFNAPAAPMVDTSQLFAAASPAPAAKRRSLKPFLAALLAVLVLGGASAAAYVGVIVPNKPANVLKAAFINSFQQKQVSSDGSFEASPASGSGLAYKVDFKTAADSTAKAADMQLNITVSGISFPIEARLVGQNVYVKVGDLNTIAGLVGAYSPDAATLAQSLNSELSNKWIIIDSTLLNENAGVKCALNANWTLTSADMQLLENQYVTHPFATIQSSSSDTVHGKAAEKFALSIDDDKLNNFGTGLKDLSIIKTLQKCDSSMGSSGSSPSIADHDHTPLTVWVDKGSKRIVQITSSTTSQDAKNSNIAGTLKLSLSYGKVSLTAPSNPEPAVQVLTDIENSAKADPQLLNLFSGGSTDDSTPTTTGNTLLQ